MTVKSKAAQEFIPIKEIRDGVVIMKDGTLRRLLMASSINFALKSADEQASVLMQFQSFLNSNFQHKSLFNPAVSTSAPTFSFSKNACA